jgi:hypothetical protein
MAPAKKGSKNQNSRYWERKGYAGVSKTRAPFKIDGAAQLKSWK